MILLHRKSIYFFSFLPTFAIKLDSIIQFTTSTWVYTLRAHSISWRSRSQIWWLRCKLPRRSFSPSGLSWKCWTSLTATRVSWFLEWVSVEPVLGCVLGPKGWSGCMKHSQQTWLQHTEGQCGAQRSVWQFRIPLGRNDKMSTKKHSMVHRCIKRLDIRDKNHAVHHVNKYF